MSKKLENLLQAGEALNAEYKNGLMSSHLPMALIALSEMGADDDTLENFSAYYSRRLKEKDPSQGAVDANNWKDRLGAHTHNADYKAFFAAEISGKGLDATLAEYLPELMPGISGGAFHPLIRLAYALDAKNDGEAAEALAAWAIAYQELPVAHDATAATAPVTEVLADVAQDDALKQLEIAGGNIAEKMKSVSGPELAFHQNKLDLTTQSLDEVCDAMAEIFGETRDFTILHGLTSASALRKVLPRMDASDRKDALKHYGDALLAAYVTVGAPAQKPSTLDDADKSWTEIFNAIVQSKNDHAIKVIYTCHQEDARTGAPKIYKNVAQSVAFPKKPG